MINYPFIPYEKIDLSAENLLMRLIHLPVEQIVPPIDVEQFLKSGLGYTLELGSIKNEFNVPDALGCIIFENMQIWVDEDLSEQAYKGVSGRYRFTIAHEIGHDQLHKNTWLQYSTQPSLFDIGKAPAARLPSIMCRDGLPEFKPSEEKQADRFAAALLMPAPLLKIHFAQVARTVKKVSDFESAVLSELKDRFEVSREAMRIRVSELKCFHVWTQKNQQDCFI